MIDEKSILISLYLVFNNGLQTTKGTCQRLIDFFSCSTSTKFCFYSFYCSLIWIWKDFLLFDSGGINLNFVALIPKEASKICKLEFKWIKAWSFDICNDNAMKYFIILQAFLSKLLLLMIVNFFLTPHIYLKYISYYECISIHLDNFVKSRLYWPWAANNSYIFEFISAWDKFYYEIYLCNCFSMNSNRHWTWYLT